VKKIIELFQQGNLSEAISVVEAYLRDDPANMEYRSSFIELLCINNELERADKQLNMIVQRHPESLLGATNLRQLIRAQQTRLDFYEGKATPDIFCEPNAEIEAFIKLRMELVNGDAQTIDSASLALEAARSKSKFEVNDEQVNELRDLDDSLAGFIEIFGTNGNYYIVQMADIEFIDFKPASSLLESIWCRVDLEIKNGPSGEAHIPLIYVNSEIDHDKLGKSTDWLEKTENVVLGRGLKMWLVNEQAVNLHDIRKIKTLSLETA